MSPGDSRRIRRPVAAGRFYPSDEARLRNLVETLLAEAQTANGCAPKAIIVPHAGYIYSGPIAASAYARFLPEREVIKRIVLLGPAHFVDFQGLAATDAEFFSTPLGLVPVARQAIEAIRSLPQVTFRDDAHLNEHALEVQLPFLQVLLPEFTLVPLAVGDAETGSISKVLSSLWGGPETRIVISSDLSHYHEAETARQLDRETAAAIEALAPEAISETQACGRAPVCGLLRAAREHHLSARTVDLRNSGDTAGPADKVVGYGAFVFEETRV